MTYFHSTEFSLAALAANVFSMAIHHGNLVSIIHHSESIVYEFCKPGVLETVFKLIHHEDLEARRSFCNLIAVISKEPRILRKFKQQPELIQPAMKALHSDDPFVLGHLGSFLSSICRDGMYLNTLCFQLPCAQS
jgi:hypothetical protein